MCVKELAHVRRCLRVVSLLGIKVVCVCMSVCGQVLGVASILGLTVVIGSYLARRIPLNCAEFTVGLTSLLPLTPQPQPLTSHPHPSRALGNENGAARALVCPESSMRHVMGIAWGM